MIVKFTTGNHFSPDIQCQTDIYRNKSRMKRDESIYTGLESLRPSAQNAARKVQFEGQESVTVIFNGYLPSYAKDIVTAPFKRLRIAINPESKI